MIFLKEAVATKFMIMGQSPCICEIVHSNSNSTVTLINALGFRMDSTDQFYCVFLYVKPNWMEGLNECFSIMAVKILSSEEYI